MMNLCIISKNRLLFNNGDMIFGFKFQTKKLKKKLSKEIQ